MMNLNGRWMIGSALAGAILVVTSAVAGSGPCPTGSSGMGTPESPCQISTASQLAGIEGEVSTHYALVADIDLEGFNNDPDPDNVGWLPIDDFAGVLDGQEHTISNLFSSRENPSNDTGLFGSSDHAFEIRNLHLVDANVSGGSRVGVLVGEMDHEDALVENVTASGQVTGKGRSTGGLVGSNSGVIVNAEVHVDVLVDAGPGSIDGVGGLVGGNDEGEIRDSLATGSVTSHGRSAVGGLVGYNYWYGHIENSRATGDVTMIGGSSGAGGLAGWNQESSSIVNSHATGNVTAEGINNVGGLVGEMGWGATVDNGSASGIVVGDRRVGGLIGRLQEESTSVTDGWASGDVTGNDYTGGLIGEMREAELHGRVFATGNVTGNDYVGGLIGLLDNFSEEGDHDIDQAYATGHVEGNNYVGGLIGSFEHFSGTNTVHVTLSNVYATGNVDATGDMIGGLIGAIWPSGDSMLYLSRAYSAGEVNGGTNDGGLIGYNLGEVTDSYWDVDTSGQTNGAGFSDNLFEAEGLPTAAMQQQASYEGWNFTTVWSIREGTDYPRLFDVIFTDRLEIESP